MSKPTLFLPGYLQANKDIGLTEEEAKTLIPIKYIMDWFNQRIPKEMGLSPSIIPKNVTDKILILRSSTGSGKSTTIPPYFYQLFQNRTRKNIAVTQPRILTAIEISKNQIPPFNTRDKLISEGHQSWEPIIFGQNIGVQTSIFQKKPMKGMIYMTAGILTQQLFIMDNISFMEKYSLLVIDEAHERSIELDLLLFMLKKFIKQNYQNKDCPFLLIMSATFDPFTFADYLFDEIPKSDRYKGIINVAGFTFPVKEYFLDYDSQNLYSTIIQQIKHIHENNIDDFIINKELFKINEEIKESDIVKNQKFRDILVFIRGPKDVKKLKSMINKLNATNKFFEKYPVLPLGLTSESVESQSMEYKNAIERDIEDLKVEIRGEKGDITIKNPTRRVIIASNVAETGLTIETLKYVVDPGLYLSSEFFPTFGVRALVSKPVTRSMHEQRRGRAGRKYAGFCYNIFTEEAYKQIQENQFPDIIKKEIALNLLGILIRDIDPENKSNELSIKQLFMRKTPNELSEYEESINNKKINITKLDLLDIPSVDSLHNAMEKLYVLGAINMNSIPTQLGHIISKFRFISIESIKMILSGYAWGAPIQDLITIASFINFAHDLFKHDEEGKLHGAELQGKFTLFPDIPINSYSKFKTDLMMTDSFIKNILIFHELQMKLSEMNIKDVTGEGEYDKKNTKNKLKVGEEKNILEILETWCGNFGINTKIILDILDLRDNIINMMAVIGFNPFHNYEKAFSSIYKTYNDLELLEYIKIIKQCIYEGYKLNLAIYNPIEKSYFVKKSHLKIEVNSEYLVNKIDSYRYGDVNPKYIIFDELLFTTKMYSTLYTAKVGNISILDGYVAVDINYLNS